MYVDNILKNLNRILKHFGKEKQRASNINTLPHHKSSTARFRIYNDKWSFDDPRVRPCVCMCIGFRVSVATFTPGTPMRTHVCLRDIGDASEVISNY